VPVLLVGVVANCSTAIKDRTQIQQQENIKALISTTAREQSPYRLDQHSGTQGLQRCQGPEVGAS